MKKIYNKKTKQFNLTLPNGVEVNLKGIEENNDKIKFYFSSNEDDFKEVRVEEAWMNLDHVMINKNGEAHVNFANLRQEMGSKGYSKKLNRLFEIIQLKSQLNKYRILKRDTILSSVKDKNRHPFLKFDGRYPVELYRPIYDIANPYTEFIGDYQLPENVIRDKVKLEKPGKDKEENNSREDSPMGGTDRFISDIDNSNIMPEKKLSDINKVIPQKSCSSIENGIMDKLEPESNKSESDGRPRQDAHIISPLNLSNLKRKDSTKSDMYKSSP